LFTYGMQGFTVGYQRGSEVVPGLVGRCPMPEGSLRLVVFEAEGQPYRNPEAEQRAGMAMQ